MAGTLQKQHVLLCIAHLQKQQQAHGAKKLDKHSPVCILVEHVHVWGLIEYMTW